MRGVRTSSPDEFTRMGSLNSNENGCVCFFPRSRSQDAYSRCVFRSTRTGMTKACGCMRDAYTSKPPFLGGGESLVRWTAPTTESSVWRSPMIQAKSDAELQSSKEVVFSPEFMSVCLHSSPINITQISSVLHNVKPLPASVGYFHLILLSRAVGIPFGTTRTGLKFH